jgi:tetratricopeptide (TPR) repeat protein
VIEHLEKVSNSKYMALAEYYMGRVYQAQGNLEQAMIFYMKAWISAKKSDDDNIKGLICSYIAQQYFNNKDYDNAIDKLKSSFEYFNRSQENYTRKMTVLNNIGNCYIYKKMKDSAVIYYNEAIELAKTTKDSVTIIQNLGMAYLKTNEPDKAKQQLFLALNMSMDSIMKSSIYLNIGIAYEQKKLFDSAIYYVKLSTDFSIKQNNTHNSVINYKVLSILERKNGNYRKALDYIDKYLKNNERIKEKNGPNIQEIEAKYKIHDLQRKQLYYIIILCFCLATGITAALYIKHIYKKKLSEIIEKYKLSETEREKHKMELSKTEKCLTKMKSEIEERKNSEKLYLNFLQEIYNDVDKLPSDPTIFAIMKENKSSADKIVVYLQSLFYENNDWDTIYNTEKLIFDEIYKLLPELTEQEFKIVCLEYMHYTNIMIANVINSKKNTVQQIKSTIRSKLKMEKGGDIAIFIKNQLNPD